MRQLAALERGFERGKRPTERVGHFEIESRFKRGDAIVNAAPIGNGDAAVAKLVA